MYNTPREKAMVSFADACALFKTTATRCLEHAAREGVHIFGGAGYVRSGVGSKIERTYRDAQALAIPGGAESVLTDFAARTMFKKYER